MDAAVPYQPMTLARLAELFVTAENELRWRLVAEFLEEFRWEARGTRLGLLSEVPDETGDPRWDVFLAWTPSCTPLLPSAAAASSWRRRSWRWPN